MGNGERAARHVVVLGSFQPDRNVQRRDQQFHASTRSYPFTFSIPAANTWTKIVVTIPGDTAGTWVMSGNAGAMYASLRSWQRLELIAVPPSAWASANYIGATGAVSVVATNGATFYLTGVKLEIGSVATPFNRQSLAKSMADCQRYYQTGQSIYVAGTPLRLA